MAEATRFQRFLSERGASPVCEVCQKNNWSLPEDFNTMLVKLPTESQSGLLSFPSPGSMNVLLAVCLNCGNMRFHAEAVVNGTVRG